MSALYMWMEQERRKRCQSKVCGMRATRLTVEAVAQERQEGGLPRTPGRELVLQEAGLGL